MSRLRFITELGEGLEVEVLGSGRKTLVLTFCINSTRALGGVRASTLDVALVLTFCIIRFLIRQGLWID